MASDLDSLKSKVNDLHVAKLKPLPKSLKRLNQN